MAEITKLWIADKMKKWMKIKPIDKIRVTEICKAAEIERPTFYYHFKDKYDLVAWIFFQSAIIVFIVKLKLCIVIYSVACYNANRHIT